MHPVTAILALLLLTAGLALGRWSLLLGVAALVLLLYTSSGPALLTGLNTRLRRLKWLLLSILLIYGWLTPGLPIWEDLGGLSPTRQGLTEGLLRALNLAVILAGVHWLLAQLDRESLIGGVYWIARPLGMVGLRPERLALRLVLTLEYLDRVQAARPRVAARGTALDRLSDWFRSTLSSAEVQPEGSIELPLLESPARRDWLLLLAFSAALATLAIWLP
ncbi:MAG: hypothetical protein PVG82_05850 [Chromatiales bacterium]|jgi:energy-coupling factor transport system permease protein